MTTDRDQQDLLSELDSLDLVRHMLADLHDDLRGKVSRFRQLVDLSEVLGSSGTMLFGGEVSHVAWREARWSFIHGNFAATVLLCQAMVEHTLAGFIEGGLLVGDLPQRISFSETLRRCKEFAVVSDETAAELERLMSLRNPLSHFRGINDPASLSGRVMMTLEPAEAHLRRDATFAIGLTIRVLALPQFRLGK